MDFIFRLYFFLFGGDFFEPMVGEENGALVPITGEENGALVPKP
jgi:hypothetical protein